jgi:MraZ protein
MRFFTGQHDRTRDAKNRIQIPAQFRSIIEAESPEGSNFLYVTLGENRGTLSILTARRFEELAERMETEYMPGPESRRFELQFYGLACAVEMDKQGRIVLPDKLTRKARLGKDLLLLGQKNRIDLWNKADFERSLGVDWEGEDWPDWQGFLRMRPTRSTSPSS